MALDADRIHGNASAHQPIDQLQHRGATSFATGGVMFQPIIAQKQRRFAVDFPGAVKRQVDIMFAHGFHP